jgi:hypothetical protein
MKQFAVGIWHLAVGSWQSMVAEICSHSHPSLRSREGAGVSSRSNRAIGKRPVMLVPLPGGVRGWLIWVKIKKKLSIN